MSKDQLFTRTYPWEYGEVVVVGNRRDIADSVPEIVEVEFVFERGDLIDVHIVRFDPEPIDVNFKDEGHTFLYRGEWEDSNDYPDHDGETPARIWFAELKRKMTTKEGLNEWKLERLKAYVKRMSNGQVDFEELTADDRQRALEQMLRDDEGIEDL